MTQANRIDKLTWIGRGLTVLIAVPFIMSALMKFRAPPEVVQGMATMGLPESLLLTLAVLEAISILVFLIPVTSVLGAILLTGYLGGAICTHLRVGDNVYAQVLFGIVVWAALYLREPRLRQLIPLKKS
jgi:hypothetical protein